MCQTPEIIKTACSADNTLLKIINWRKNRQFYHIQAHVIFCDIKDYVKGIWRFCFLYLSKFDSLILRYCC